MKHKKQHYIPESYLKAWCDPDTPKGYEPYIWIVSKDGRLIKPKATSNVFHQTDLYTIMIDGERDLTIETSLAQLEGEFVALRRDKLEKHHQLSLNDRLVICAFTAAIYSRTLASGKRWQPFWGDVANKMKRMIQWGETATPEQIERIRPTTPPDPEDTHIVTYDEIKQLAEEPIKSLVPTHLSMLTPLLFRLDLTIVETSTKPGFITSDDPCVWFDPELQSRPFPRGPALISPSIEINLPISPTQSILYNRRGDNGYILLSKYGPQVDLSVVAEANWRTRRKANEYFVVNKRIILRSWFESGKY